MKNWVVSAVFTGPDGHVKHGIISACQAESREKAIELARTHHMRQDDKGFAAWDAYVSYVAFKEEHMP